ncbi:nonsense-mediated mRNA decay factor [Favolaschia claudopus]|uniref:Nonsense-mediated mRNA decay factor n=1 Tax=Favolaschia claudopus TaxID=2862362 RepID=A0AAW0A9Z6_9AGAR
MDSGPPNGSHSNTRIDDERARLAKRKSLKALNATPTSQESSRLDSSLKRHTALIKRMRLSMAMDNRDQILKDIDTLSLEKYVDEIVGAALEGIARCKTEKDVWSAVEIISALHRRFPATFTPAMVSALSGALAAPSRATLAALAPEQREKDDTARVIRQRPVLRLSNDPTLSSLPLLSTFLKSYSRPYLGIVPPVPSKQIPMLSEPGTASAAQSSETESFPVLSQEEDELVEQEIRDRFKRMCEGYFENVCKKLIIEHTRLQEQDRRNHEAYIRSGEIFEDRQQAYEKMTKGYEKLLASCQSLSELLYLPLPALPTNSQKSDSILIGANRSSTLAGDENDDAASTGGKWEDEEERRFFEDVQDLKDFVPRGVLGIDEPEGKESESDPSSDNEKERLEKEKEEVRKLEEELENLGDGVSDKPAEEEEHQEILNEEDASTPTPGTPKATSPPLSPQLAPQGPSQLLTALLVRLPDATNRALIDQAAIDFAFLNSKAARKRLIKFLGQVPKNRIDLLPHYSRLVATLAKYMPDVGTELVAILDEEFRYLQRKKNVVKELSEVRMKNIMYLSNLTKFRVVPSHLILHVFKVCLDDFSGTNVENLALLLEGCGRFLLRSEETHQRFGTMQSMQHFDQRQLLLLENAYYQCNPPERAPRQEKQRTPIELFIRHLIYDVLAKKTIDKVLKLIRKIDWEQEDIRRVLHKIFTKPWKIKFSNISLLAMLTYDLQRYHPEFAVGVVDQVLEDARRGLEQNVYSTNQRRVATIKYLGELYIYRLLSSGIVFDTLCTPSDLENCQLTPRPLPNQVCAVDMPDDFFRYYVHCKEGLPMDVDFMLSDSLEVVLSFARSWLVVEPSTKAVRPKLEMPKTLEEAANAVDEMLNSAFQTSDLLEDEGESGDESGDEDSRPEETERDDEEDEEAQTSPVDERAPSPDELVVLSASNSLQDNLGPSEEAEAEFAKELAKMVTDSSAESRKVDKKTALALWDAAVLPPGARKKRPDETDDEPNGHNDNSNMMNFTVITKKGNKQQTRQIAVPSASALAVHTRSAQQQDRVEQQHLKRLVLDYEQREEAEELKDCPSLAADGLSYYELEVSGAQLLAIHILPSSNQSYPATLSFYVVGQALKVNRPRSDIVAPRLGTSTREDEPWSWESREFLRALAVGKEITFVSTHSLPPNDEARERDFGNAQIAGHDIIAELLRNGWAKMKDIKREPTEEDLRKREYENEAKSAGKGIWNPHGPQARTVHHTMPEDSQAFVSEWKGKSLDALAGVRSARTASKQGEPSEPWGEEAKFFTESRLLQRAVRVQILSLPTSSATPFQSGANGGAPTPASIFIGTVLHPAGNVAEHLVAAGLARVVDWHAGMLASSGGMEKLRAAEKNAKEKRLCLYANAPVTSASKSNTTTSNGQVRVFDATVIRVWSGDQISVAEKDSGKERRLQLSSTRGPKLSDPKQAHYAQEAREFLRKKLIGKHVKVTVDFVRPREGDFEERECATIRYGNQNANIAEQLIEKGLAGLVRHKRDDEDRASDYDKLMAAEQASVLRIPLSSMSLIRRCSAVADTRGIHSGKDVPPAKQPLNISESASRATQFLNGFKRMGKIPAIVDYVAAGSRFKLLLPKDNQTLTLVLGGIRAPRTARNASEKSEPYGAEAAEFASRRYMQRDVEFEVDTLDKSGGFIGSLYVNKTDNAAVTLVREGLATVHSFSADGLPWSRQLYDAEVWSDYDDEAEQAAAPVEDANGPLKPQYIDVIVSDLMRDFSLHHRSSTAAPPNFTPKSGELVSAKFSDGSWYRAKIRRISALKKEAEVTFIDYGNQDTVALSNLRPLEPKFRSLPGQAHEARLSFVKLVGPESEYFGEAVDRFRSLCEGRKLVANIDHKEGSLLHLRLMDPTDPAAAEDPLACINAELLHDGVAAIDRKGCRYLGAYPQVVKKLQSAVSQAKKERLGTNIFPLLICAVELFTGMFEFGDVEEDD